MTLEPQPANSLAPSSPVTGHLSPWHSPVPYLFGGLAATLSLISFALLILACSYFKQSVDTNNSLDVERDLEDGVSKPENRNKGSPNVIYKEKYLVVMAGQATPTFLATPVSSRASSFGTCSCGSNSRETSSISEVKKMENVQLDKQVSNEQVCID